MLDIDHVYPPHFISQNSNMILKPEAHLATHAQLHDLLNDNAAPLCAILSTEHQCQLKKTQTYILATSFTNSRQVMSFIYKQREERKYEWNIKLHN